MVPEKKYKYTAKIKQPQIVAGVKLEPKGGTISEKELKAIKKDAYGESLLESKMLVIGTEPVTVTEVETGDSEDKTKQKKSQSESGHGTAGDGSPNNEE